MDKATESIDDPGNKQYIDAERQTCVIADQAFEGQLTFRHRHSGKSILKPYYNITDILLGEPLVERLGERREKNGKRLGSSGEASFVVWRSLRRKDLSI